MVATHLLTANLPPANCNRHEVEDYLTCIAQEQSTLTQSQSQIHGSVVAVHGLKLQATAAHECCKRVHKSCKFF